MRRQGQHLGWAVGLWLAVGVACAVRALGPQEVAVIYNEASPDSLWLANTYCALRTIPEANRIGVRLPDRVPGPQLVCSSDVFEEHIYRPVLRQLQERGIDRHVRAWAFSADFPIRITGKAPLSLMGAVFSGGRPPDAKAVKSGAYASLYFRGPSEQGGAFGPTLSFERFDALAGGNPPVPSMMLGHTGARGLSRGQTLEVLKRGARSDYSAPQGTFYFVKTSDIRSKMRDWQFEQAAEQLRKRGFQAVFKSKIEREPNPITGYCTGRAFVDTSLPGAFLPGAIAEHITSFGGALHNSNHTKLTEWLRNGATASAGTVVEPFALWTKFPHARTHVHYALGCTLMESIYQGLACPVQLLIVGEPLAKPWAPPVKLTLIDLSDTAAPRQKRFMASVWGGQSARLEYAFYLDGKLVRPFLADPQYRMDANKLADGWHRLRAVARVVGPIGHQGFAETDFVADRVGRHVSIVYEGSNRIDVETPVRLTVHTTKRPRAIDLVEKGRVLDRADDPSRPLTLDPTRTGEGPIIVRARAWYAGDDRPVSSAPLSLIVTNMNRPPVIESVKEVSDRGRCVSAADADGDDITVEWYEPVDTTRLESFAALDGDLLTAPVGEGWQFAPTDEKSGMRAYPPDRAGAISGVTAVVHIPEQALSSKDHFRAGVVFHVNDQAFWTFGFDGPTSAWLMGRRMDDQWVVADSVGFPIEENRSYRVSVRAVSEGRVEALVDGRVVLTRKAPMNTAGIWTQRRALETSGFARTPPTQGRVDGACARGPGADRWIPVVSDGRNRAWFTP